MLHHTQSKILPYTVDQMYAMVADVESYPTFLPGCQECRILEKLDDTRIHAAMTVGHSIFKETFESMVTFAPLQSITVTGGHGMLKALKNQWSFTPAPEGCTVSFDISFTFGSFLVERMFEPFFQELIGKMVAAFEARAQALYA